MPFQVVSSDARQPRPDVAAAASSNLRAAKDRRLTALMRASQNGDRAAYTRLLRELVPVLQRLMRRKVRFVPAADREDLVQDVLLSLHVAKSKYDKSRPFMPWFMKIAQNRIIDGARRQTRIHAREVLVDEPASIGLEETCEPVEDGYGDPEALRQAVNLLPNGQRKAIELVMLREMSLKEAADLSGMSMGALKVSVHRGIKNLRGSFA